MISYDEVIEIVNAVSSKYEYIVVASITSDCALKAAESITDKEVICVTCPQGMSWEVDKMDEGPFAIIPELAQIKSAWTDQGLTRVPMGITKANIVKNPRIDTHLSCLRTHWRRI